MKEYCQPGIEPIGLPAWCVEQDFGTMFIVQGIFEIVIIIGSIILLSKLMKKVQKWWKKFKRSKRPLKKWKNPF